MPRLVPTPTDELSGLPLPLAPYSEPLLPSNADLHHHFHPRRSLDPNIPGELAVRQCRVQFANYDVHHNQYHNVYGGPVLPKTEQEQFRTVILATAGYIPEEALGFRNRKSQLVRLSPDQRLHLQSSGEIKVENVLSVRTFIRDYVINQPIAGLNINELTVEEFLETKQEDRRRLLGHTLLALSTIKATEFLSKPYRQAYEEQLIRPGIASNVQRFTKVQLGTKRMRDRIVYDLRKKLAA